MGTTAWYEFPFVDEVGGGANVVGRLAALLAIASRLEAAGWPLKLTTTGLAFEAPEGAGDELLRLGVEEPFTDMPGGTLAEVLEAVGRLHDSLRERRLDPEEFGRLAALYWVLGSHTPRAERDGLGQAEAVSG